MSCQGCIFRAIPARVTFDAGGLLRWRLLVRKINKYHPKWTLISRLIRYRRAGNRCEWCGLENGLIGRRAKPVRPGAPSVFTELSGDDLSTITQASAEMSWREKQRFYKRRGVTRIILSVAHIDRNRTNNRFHNLAALCQRCHLLHDGRQHVYNTKYGREVKYSVLTFNF